MAKSNFIIQATIRDGHLTRVLKAEQPSLKRTVLIKTLHKHLITDGNLVRRFEREARACAMIRSEHIVQVYDLIELDDAPAIVMEYVEGKSLQELLQQGVQSEQFARLVAESVLTALSVAHRAGVVHRDIKPANIMVDGHGVVKVADFGLASVGVETTLTLEGTVLGTPAYMSPEQVSGGSVDGRSDLFSLGVTLIELVTGEKLFQGETYAECLNKILNFKIESIDRFAGIFSDSFLAFVRRLMMPRKEDRFSSANEALRELTGKEPVLSGKSSEARVRFTRSMIVGFGAFGILVVVAIIYFWPAAKSQEDNKTSNVPLPMHDTTKADTQSVAVMKQPSGQNSVPLNSQRKSAEQVLTADAGRDAHAVSQKPASSEERTLTNPSTDSGFVQISCTPWAKVFLGNEYVGTTPIAGSLKVKAGVHTVTFNNPSFLSIVRSVTVHAGTQSHVEANFLEQVGYLVVVSQPWAHIYVDDQYRETTPLGQPLMVTSGNRKIRLNNPAFEDFVTTVNVGLRDTVRVVNSFTVK